MKKNTMNTILLLGAGYLALKYFMFDRALDTLTAKRTPTTGDAF